MGDISKIIRQAAGAKRFCSAVILAAGSGRRFDDSRAKQFMEIGGESVLIRSVRVFQQSELYQEIVVVTRQADIEGVRNTLVSAGMTKVTRVIAGGDTRQESAKRGFDAVNPACTYVAIHDAARCLLTDEMLDAVMESAFVTGAAACAQRAVDTLKRTNGNNDITETIDRENCWQVQTPQVFLADMYRAASYLAEKDHVLATDDCALCERLGFSVRLVDCGRTNMKITYPEDVVIAEAILAARERKPEENA
ncbi:MAG: 2-C-methyl-D-erythritol 4-phosphate cytidylyltransferase [Clostridia bacterium]|nr:2-C-methyl-D-erythritol 4-phosphate cytidylyltransferase [Clostridia bacterium]